MFDSEAALSMSYQDANTSNEKIGKFQFSSRKSERAAGLSGPHNGIQLGFLLRVG